MNTHTTTTLTLTGAALAMVACTSLPGNINKGIAEGSPYAYYEAGQHIDASKVSKDCPGLVAFLLFPVNICTGVAGLFLGYEGEDTVRVQNCFYYRSIASKNKEAAKYYLKGAELGDADCMYEMGRNYENGWGVAKDQAKAYAYYTQAAQKGHAQAQAKVTVKSPDSIIGKRLCVRTNTEWNGLNTVVKDDLITTGDFCVYISYEKTGPDTAELNLCMPGPDKAQDNYYLRFTDNRHAVITKGWAGAVQNIYKGGRLIDRQFQKHPIKNISGTVTIE